MDKVIVLYMRYFAITPLTYILNVFCGYFIIEWSNLGVYWPYIKFLVIFFPLGSHSQILDNIDILQYLDSKLTILTLLVSLARLYKI